MRSEDLHTAYGAYKLRTAQNYIYILAIIASVFSVLLIICDLNFANNQSSRLVVALIRYAYAILLIFVSGWLTRIKSFSIYTIVVSLLELVSVAISLYVLTQYASPNFMIQSMGLVATVLVIYLVPNRMPYQLALSLVSALGFYAFTCFYISNVTMNEMLASVVYTLIAIILCTVSVYNSEKNQLREYIAKNRLEQMSSTDFLTNTANRFRLEEEADRWMNFCRRQKLPLCLVFVDVDNLKQINDSFGHAAGDTVLVTLSALMQKQLRNSDTISRWGGDEFVLLLPNVSLENAIALLERLKTLVLKTDFGVGIAVTCSFGVVEMGESSSFQSLLHEADALMYSGKRDGKDTIRYTGPEE
ncbi:MAG: GGDEF domain-containing protein [Eubacteriales bacterium]|nr:GGDEF domain-containing protein [Eubacteriales bacterium]